MMLRAPETEALDEGYAQKGFGDPSIDGSPFPLGSTATSEPIEIPRSLWGRWRSPDATGILLHPCGSRSKAIQNISDNQQPSRDKQLSKRLDLNTAAVVVNEEALERILERMFEVKILRVSSSRAVRGHRSGRGIYFVSLGWFLFIAFICLQC
ncbi:MAG: hypothetical protein RQ885_14715 [Desulfurococcales archaeon]|jgi:hypothetical protein|nr:hypothetical protein [Desulfurococcales archaeon]